MITGFNTDITHQERVFHVQTEDKGLRNPQVESLIYCGGEIIATRQNSYADLAESGGYSEDEIQRRMEFQHQAMIREITNGRFDSDEPMPFGHNLVSNRSLDQVVLLYLQNVEGALGPVRLTAIDQQILLEGTRPTLRLHVHEKSSGEPVEGAQVTVTLISTQRPPLEVFSADTDHDGYFEAVFEIPEMTDGSQAVVCAATAGSETVEIRQLIEKGKPHI